MLMDKIRIAFVIDEISKHMGGTERQLMLLLKHMNKILFEPYLVCLRGDEAIALEVSFNPIHVISFNSFFLPTDYLKLIGLARFFREKRICIVQTYLRDGNIVGTLAARLAGVANIVSSRRNLGYWYNRTELMILKALRSITTGYIVNSYSIKRRVIEVEKIPSKKIKVIYNGIDYSAFSPKSEDTKLRCRRSLGISDDCIIVGMIANLRPIKAVDMFLRAAAIVAIKYPNVRFLIVGEGTERGNLALLSAKLGISDRVLFIGNTDHDDIPILLSICSVGVLSSKSEGLPNAIIEYMSMGLPVVCTDVGGNSELVENGRNGFLVPVSDYDTMAKCILRILDSPELMDKMSKESFKRARDLFSVNSFVKNHEEYYLTLMNGMHSI